MRPLQIKKMTARATSFVATAFLLSACGLDNGAGSRVGNPPTVSTTSAFPENFAVTSPLENEDAIESGNLTRSLATHTGAKRPAYHAAVDRISNILEGEAASACAFDPAKLLIKPSNAECYGPNVAYTNHPDTLSGQSANGILPPGDLGIWSEYDEPTNNACAAAQLNARMRGLQFRSQTALEALASLLCAAKANGIALPEEGGTLDLKAEFAEINAANDLGLTIDADDAINLTITKNADGSITYGYEMEFVFTDEDGAHNVELAMTHVALNDEGDYKGKFSYVVETADEIQNNCPQDDITDAGSVLYSMDGTEVALLADQGSYCGHDADPVQSDGLLDPSDKFNAASNPDGWGLNFNTVTANFDRETIAGDYALVWQAGPNDDASRTFNVTLDADADTELLDGTAFFGFGQDIADTDGAIDGFICNWAGPGAVHTVRDFVQRQGLQQSESDSLFDSVTDELNIQYAPVNSCSYAGGGNFTFDLDPNVNDTLMTDPANPVPNDLLILTDTTFTDAGFVLPTAPENDF